MSADVVTLCEVDMLERGASSLQRLDNILHPDSRRHVQVACVPCGVALPSEAAVVQSNIRSPEEPERAKMLLMNCHSAIQAYQVAPDCSSSQCMALSGRFWKGRHGGEPPNAR